MAYNFDLPLASHPLQGESSPISVYIIILVSITNDFKPTTYCRSGSQLATVDVSVKNEPGNRPLPSLLIFSTSVILLT